MKPVIVALLLASLCSAQNQQDQRPQIIFDQDGNWLDRLRSAYRPRYVSTIDFNNSTRIDSLIRAGQLYLSLQDAIALAIENNLDIELQRFAPKLAASETERAEGGGLLRGLQLTIRQLPQGVGGPGAPLLTTVGGTSAATNVPNNSADLALITPLTTDLNIEGTVAFAPGAPIPSFDPAIVGQLNYAHQTTPQTSYAATGSNALINTNFNGNVGFTQSFASGTSYNIGYNNVRTTSNLLNSNYNPYTNASLGLTVTQPLLQGFSVATNRRFIRIAKNEERIADSVFQQQLIETVSGVIRLYWDLVSLVEDVRVKQQALTLAQKLYEDNKSQVEVGTLAPLELKRAQAEVARGRQDLTNSRSLVLQQEILLKNVLTRTGTVDPLLRAARIVPLDTIEIPAREQIEPVQDLLDRAIQKRPDLFQARVQLENTNIYLKGSRNELLPQLNLVGSLQNTGFAGQANTPLAGSGFARTPDDFLLGGYGNALEQIFARNFPNYAVGLQLTIPLKNRVAQADVIRDELQVRQTEVRLKQLQVQIRLEVENALVSLQRARASYDAAIETRQLQEEALAAEQERYSVGASTSFFVIQYQRDLEQARSTEVVAKNNYAKARAALDRSVGDTLTRNDVQIEEAYRGRVSKPPTPIPATVQGAGPQGSR